jgi:hypothetical protein
LNIILNTVLSNPKTATQQSVQWMVGILRDLQAFFWLRVFPALKHFPSPPASNANRWVASCKTKTQVKFMEAR